MSFEQISSKEEKIKDTPEDLRYKLGRIMEDIAQGANEEFGENILNSDASINMRQWMKSANCPSGYRREEVKGDEKAVWRRKLSFSNLSEKPQKSEGVVDLRAWEKKRDEKLAIWEKQRGESKPALLELATTAIFHKILKGKFLVVRSSAFDDFENGADNIIVNRETGDVVCAFDEVRECGDAVEKIRFNEKGEEETIFVKRTEEKDVKIIRKAEKGGAVIKYGFGLEDGKLARKEITGVPMFYLSVETGDLDKLLENMDYETPEPNKTELEVFDNLIESLSNQAQMLKNKNIHPAVARNLGNFEKSLEEIRELRKKF